jgi:hypothetical protein
MKPVSFVDSVTVAANSSEDDAPTAGLRKLDKTAFDPSRKYLRGPKSCAHRADFACLRLGMPVYKRLFISDL